MARRPVGQRTRHPGWKQDYGALVFTDKAVRPLAIGTTYIYRNLLRAIVGMFETKRPPVAIAETVEIVAFIEAANKSAANHGTAETVAT